MEFLKQVDANLKTGEFTAKFFNGKTTNNKTVAAFYMMMQDKDADIDEAKSYISLGKQIDPFKPWDEISEVLA